MKYWKNHHAFPILDGEAISWEPNRLATKLLPLGIQRFYVKFLSGHIGTRHMLKHRREIDSAKCLNCNSCKVEKAPHILRCKNPKAKKNHKKR